MNSNGKLMVLTTMIIAVMIASVSLAGVEAHNDQGNNKTPLKGTNSETDILEILDITSLDKDTIVSSALTRLTMAMMPAMSVTLESIGETTTFDLEFKMNNGHTASFHTVVTIPHKNTCQADVKYVTLDDEKIETEMSVTAAFQTDEYLEVTVKDGSNTLVIFGITVKEAPYDKKTDSAAVRMEIDSVQLPNVEKFTTNQIVYFDIKGSFLDYVTVIFPNNDNRDAVLYHYHNVETHAGFDFDLTGVEYKSDVIYVWTNKGILEEHILS